MRVSQDRDTFQSDAFGIKKLANSARGLRAWAILLRSLERGRTLMKVGSTQIALRAACALMLALVSNLAHAHVKWFVDFDVAKAPLPIGDVLTGTFIAFLIASTLAVYVFFLTDRYLYKQGVLREFDLRLRRFDGFSIRIMRYSASLFFIALWLWYLQSGSSFFLTPELKTQATPIPYLHLALGLCALLAFTTPLTGVGIFVLYGLAVREYGAFHMIDYLIFLGIGYFFLVSNIQRGQWKKSGFIVLFASTGITLIWASVEKFAYPHWTYPLLANNPDMLMGMQPYAYMVLAGFIEFNVTFILLGAVSVIGRFVALGLQTVFVLAIVKFGMIDAVGHLMIIATLFVLVVRGPTDAREMLVLRDKSVWTEAYFMTGLYYLALNVIFILYYGLHYLNYGVSAGSPGL